MNNLELAQFCVDNNTANNSIKSDFIEWDLIELCISYFLQCTPLFWNFEKTFQRCKKCRNYKKIGTNCQYCDKGVSI